MRKRYDYRNDYKEMSLENLTANLVDQKERLAEHLNLSMETSDDVKRIVYMETLIKKKKQ